MFFHDSNGHIMLIQSYLRQLLEIGDLEGTKTTLKSCLTGAKCRDIWKPTDLNLRSRAKL